MNTKYTYLLALLFLLGAGCGKIDTKVPNSILVPSGNFTGVFRRVHVKNGKYDTLKASLMLNMSVNSGFKITGDTATVHAGSYGSYAISSDYTSVQFLDLTSATKGPAPKVHLNGTYNYLYNGTRLQIVANSALDTLSYQYDMTAVN
jgi:hypothetical protein